ncbi:MAG: hypothetical protein SFV24_16745 [Gemmatimonadales bacterium]|nr:hypothetical protein [Gemmatimonadales bacterium]
MSGFDPDNPIVDLCARGMMAEGEGRAEEARALFLEAWSRSRDDFEAAIAAHYLARHQSPAEGLHWNQVALDRALAAGTERTAAMLPSLYLNLGLSQELTAQPDEAGRAFRRAAEWVSALPDDGYGNMVRRGIEAGLGRVDAAGDASG